MKLHLSVWSDDATWCDESGSNTDDPREATCTECLRNAAEYGAAAAMRCAAVEAGGGSDPELEKERDDALRSLDNLRKKLVEAGWFMCQTCERLMTVSGTGFVVGNMRWCTACSGARGRVL